MSDNIAHESFSTACAENFVIFNQQRESNELCDVTILASGRKLNAHKIILSSASPYFRKMFTLAMMEMDLKEINLPEISYETMEQIIQFIYTGKISVSTETAENILNAANFLQLVKLVDLCGKYIIKQIDDANCFSMKDLLIRTNCDEEIIAKAKDYINTNFQQISQTRSFLQLDINDVVELLSSSELCCESEDEVAQSAIRWLKSSRDREKYSQQIYNCFRFPLLSDSFKSEHATNKSLLLPDTHRKFKTSILALPGTKATGFQLYDPSSNEWKKVVDFEAKRNHRMTSNNEKVFISGLDYETNMRVFDILDLKTKQLISLPPLPNARDVKLARIFLHILNQKLRVFCEKRDRLLVDVFDMTTNSWTAGPVIAKNFDKSICIAVDDEIYAFCWISENRTCHKLDQKTHTFVEIVPVVPIEMREVNYIVGQTTYNEKIYFAVYSSGGDAAFEVYDPFTNEWKQLASWNTNLFEYQLVTTTDGIFIIGMDYDGTSEFVVESYNAEKDKWSVKGYCPDEFRGCRKVSACSVPSFYFR